MNLAATLTALFRPDQLRTDDGPAVVHAALYHLCAERIRALDAVLDRPEPHGRFRRHSVDWSQRLENEPKSLEALGQWLRKEARGSEDRALIALASASNAIDRVHARPIHQLSPLRVVDIPSMPGWTGPSRLALLADPPELGWTRLGAIEPLDRGISHFRHHLPSLLDLRWQAIDLGLVDELRLVDLADQEKGDPATEELLALGAEREGGLRLGLASPFREMAFQTWSLPDDAHDEKKGVPYRFVALAGGQREAREEIDRILRVCRDESIDILCFPELTLDDHLLHHLRDRLEHLESDEGAGSPALVVAGSFTSRTTGAGSIAAAFSAQAAKCCSAKTSSHPFAFPLPRCLRRTLARRSSSNSASTSGAATRKSRLPTSWCSSTLRVLVASRFRFASISAVTS